MSTDAQRPLYVELSFRIGTYDIDWAGHVNNGVYIRWLEDLRLEMLHVHYPMEDLLAEGLMPILVRTEVDYVRPVRLFDKPVGRMWCTEMGRASMRIAAEILVDGQVCCRAAQRGALIREGNGRPARMPEGLLAAYQAGV